MITRSAVALMGAVLLAPSIGLGVDANLDPAFANFGVATTTLDFVNDVGVGMALQTDGKIVVVGLEHNNGSFEQIGLVRYLPNGTLDPLFGVGGKVTTAIGSFA